MYVRLTSHLDIDTVVGPINVVCSPYECTLLSLLMYRYVRLASHLDIDTAGCVQVQLPVELEGEGLETTPVMHASSREPQCSLTAVVFFQLCEVCDPQACKSGGTMVSVTSGRFRLCVLLLGSYI